MMVRGFSPRADTLSCKRHREHNSLFSGPRRWTGILRLRNFPNRGQNDRRSAIAFNEQYEPAQRFVSSMLRTVTIIPGRNACSSASGA